MASRAGANPGRGHLVLRVRLGIDYDYDSLDPLEFMDHLAERVRQAAADAGAELDVLQVGVGGDPRWMGFGPDNRVEGRPIP